MTTFRDAHLRNSRTVFSYDRKMISFFEFLEDQKSRELQWRLISWATASWATLFWFSRQKDFIDYLTIHFKKTISWAKIYEKIIIPAFSSDGMMIQVTKFSFRYFFWRKSFRKYLSIGRICQFIFNFKVFTVRSIETGSTRNFSGVGHKLSQNLRVRAKTYSFCGIRSFQ